MNSSIILILTFIMNLAFLGNLNAQFECRITIHSPIQHIPLFILDNLPTDSTNLQRLDSKEIESIQILTGLEASAVYGTKGAHGAIVIFTKQGLKNNRKLRKQFKKTDVLKVSVSPSSSEKHKINIVFNKLPSRSIPINIKVLDTSHNIVSVTNITDPNSGLNYFNSYTLNLEEGLDTGVYTLIIEQGKQINKASVAIK